MNFLQLYLLVFSRVLLAVIFLVNGFGVIDQKMAAIELIERGAPAAIAQLFVMGGRVLQIIAGFGLALGVFPQWSALALLACLVPATLVSHSFWRAARTPAFQPLLLQCCKNLAMCGGLLFIAASTTQPRLFPKRVDTLPGGQFASHASLSNTVGTPLQEINEGSTLVIRRVSNGSAPDSPKQDLLSRTGDRPPSGSTPFPGRDGHDCSNR
jgi:putative oxidoreductase